MTSPPSTNGDAQPGTAAQQPALRVGFILLESFTLAAFAGLIDALRLAADSGGRSRQIHTSWRIMTPGAPWREASCGLRVTGAEDFLDPGQFNYIAVCGGNDYHVARAMPALDNYLRQAHRQGVRMLGVCTGSFAIARAGLADERTLCIHWNVLDAFRKQFPHVRATVDRLFVDEGDLITCAGSTAAIDMGLHLVSRHCGRNRAQQVVRHMMLAGMRAPSLPQAHFVQEMEHVTDDRVLRAVHFMEQQIDYPPSLPVVARYVGVSSRQLQRAFKAALDMTPMQMYRIMRVKYGRWKLDNTRESITRIALDCGFADTAHFSREFTALFGISPSHCRRAGRADAGPANAPEVFPDAPPHWPAPGV